MSDKIKLLDWARRIQAISQTGLEFANNEYDIERNKKLEKIAAEIISENSNLNTSELLNIFSNQKGYATPKVDVRTAIVKVDKILLVKEISDGKWAMPGGWADVGDVPSEAAIREAKEESGFDVEIIKVVGVYDANRNSGELELFHAVKIVYLCKIIAGKPTPSFETPEVSFFDLNNLPPLSENRTNPRHIEHIKAHLSNPIQSTFFD
ncbi:MAG TPA: NUDIX domain-containing protein [Ignavibacteria bacterium]|nr:NUDIX domain-containing protein [Ignavibacteria bacterium]